MIFEIELETVECNLAGCGMFFALPKGWIKQRRIDGHTFYCPNGHARAYRPSDYERLQGELNEALHAVLVTQKQLKKETVANRRMAVRAKAGVCACCNRTFSNLANHMNSKHAGRW